MMSAAAEMVSVDAERTLSVAEMILATVEMVS